jgi:protein TonB
MTRAFANSNFAANDSTPFATLLTLVLWIFCVAVGVVGFVIPYTRPKIPVAAPPPVQAELIKVELTETELPPEIVPQPATVPQPSAIKPIEIPQAPPMIAVAEPSPAVAFALPVEAPARIADVKSASTTRPVEKATTTTPAPVPVKTLTFGSGEGKQPAPEYPARARREGQQGVVLVRFTVGENGRVLSAEAAKPSPWPLLNESAVRAVRERWRFAEGGLRLYEVAIRFQMR